MSHKIEVGSRVTITCVVMSSLDETGHFNAVPASCAEGGAPWIWLSADDVQAVSHDHGRSAERDAAHEK